MRTYLPVGLLVGLALGSVCAPVRAQDPVTDFILESDALAQAAKTAELRNYVSERQILVGSVCGQLVDVALQMRADDPAAAEENVSFAEELLKIHAELGGSAACAASVEDYRRWSDADFARREEAKALEAAAGVSRDEGELDRAVAELEEARVQLEGIGDRRSVAVLWGSLGVVHWYRGDWDAVRASYRQALEARRSIDDAILEGRTLNGLGSVNFATGQPAEALSWYKQAIVLRRKTGDLAGLGTSLGYAANCQLQLGDVDAASRYFEESLPVLERTGNAAKLIETLNNLGNLHHQTADYTGALSSYDRALSLATENGIPDTVALLHVNRANTLRYEGRLREALSELAAAEASMEGATDPTLPLRLEQERAMTSLLLGENDAAIQSVGAAARMAGELETPDLIADVALTSAWVYRELGSFDRAMSSAERALELAVEMGDIPRQRDAWLSVAMGERLLGRPEAALTAIENARKIDHESELNAQSGESELELANILDDLGRKDEARAGYRRAAQLLADAGRSDNDWVAILGVAHTFEASDPDSAAYWYDLALARVEADRELWGGAEERSSFLSYDRGRAFEEITRYYVELHQSGKGEQWDERALRVADRAKAQALAGSNDWDLNALRQHIGKGAAILVFAVGDSASFGWVLDRDGIERSRLPARDELRAQLRQLRDALARPGAGDATLRATASQLYEALVAPHEARLDRAERIWIVPDDVLHELPFALLLREPAEPEEAWKDLKWFDERWSVEYVPSLALFGSRVQGSEDSYELEVLGVGNPMFSKIPPAGGERPLQPLPHTEAELLSIREQVGDDRVALLLAGDATRTGLFAALQEKPPRVLHLATHGIVDAAEPSLSCVALSDDDGGGYWYAGEIEELSLSSELVVLSACETGRGRLERGEGVVGLTRAFLAAGATSVVSSLWSVSDESTARLMTAYYDALYDGEFEVGDALQKACKQVREDTEMAHPFHWAAFVAMTLN